MCQRLVLNKRGKISIILNARKGTYAGRPTDMISASLTVRIRFTMTLPVSTGVLRGAPDQNVQIAHCTLYVIPICCMTSVRNSYRQDPTSLLANATSCSCEETLIIMSHWTTRHYLFGTHVRPSPHWSFWSQSP